MTIKKIGTSQQPLITKVPFTFADFANGAVTATTVFEALDMPLNAIVVGGSLIITVAFDGPTAATASVGDSASAARYLADTNILAAGTTALVPTGFEMSAAEVIALDIAMSDNPATAGEGILIVEYVVENRANQRRFV